MARRVITKRMGEVLLERGMINQKELEKAVVEMAGGARPKDEAMIGEYKTLLGKVRGSGPR